MFRDIIRWKCPCCMSGKATHVKVNQLRYESFSQKYQGTSGQVPIAVNDIFFLLSLTLALVFLLLAEYHHTGKCIRRFGGIYAYCRYFKDR